MRIEITMLLLGSAAFAHELSPNVLRLIDEDAAFVRGSAVERHEESPLGHFFPSRAGSRVRAEDVRSMVSVESKEKGVGYLILLLRNPVTLDQFLFRRKPPRKQY